jgi:hypothetical protein
MKKFKTYYSVFSNLEDTKPLLDRIAFWLIITLIIIFLLNIYFITTF